MARLKITPRWNMRKENLARLHKYSLFYRWVRAKSFRHVDPRKISRFSWLSDFRHVKNSVRSNWRWYHSQLLRAGPDSPPNINFLLILVEKQEFAAFLLIATNHLFPRFTGLESNRPISPSNTSIKPHRSCQTQLNHPPTTPISILRHRDV